MAFKGCTKLEQLNIEGTPQLGDSITLNCKAMRPTSLPEDITEISVGEYYDWTSLTNVVIPKQITKIPDIAFHDCQNMTTLVVGDGVETIGHLSFASCNKLTEITLGRSVKSIGAMAFFGVNDIKDIYCHGNTPPECAERCFSKYKHIKLHVPASAIEAYRAVKPWACFAEIVGDITE